MITKYELFSNSVACLYRDIQKLERMEMAKYGLKGPHAQCLLSLSRYPEGLIATELCDLCEKDKAAISRTVAELEEVGLVERIGRHGSRYRAALVLTEHGRTRIYDLRVISGNILNFLNLKIRVYLRVIKISRIYLSSSKIRFPQI